MWARVRLSTSNPEYRHLCGNWQAGTLHFLLPYAHASFSLVAQSSEMVGPLTMLLLFPCVLKGP